MFGLYSKDRETGKDVKKFWSVTKRTPYPWVFDFRRVIVRLIIVNTQGPVLILTSECLTFRFITSIFISKFLVPYFIQDWRIEPFI